jgi:endonuclease YncB( thermonuclease family)
VSSGEEVRVGFRTRRVFVRRQPARGGRRAVWLAAGVVLAAGAAAAWLGLVQDAPRAPPPAAEGLPKAISAAASEVRVVDGDTLRLGAITVRLAGLDAPERGQDCHRADGSRYDCGEAAARHLASLVHRRAVACDTLGRDRYGRAIAVCRAEGVDLAEAMVASGWAIAVPEGSRGQARYGMAEARARSGRQGLWEGRFETPEAWRRGN